jgi:hypothetical protein
MQAFFQVRLKFATIVIQDDSPFLPGIGFTKQPFSALYPHHWSTQQQVTTQRDHLHKPDPRCLLRNLIERLNGKPAQ